MTRWELRPQEERGLLSPSFLATLLWHAAQGYENEPTRSMAFEEAFLILPVVLHKGTRDLLPRTTRTSLPTWLDEHRLVRSNVGTRAKLLVPYAKEAMAFGLTNNLIQYANGAITANQGLLRKVNSFVRQSSDEVKECAKRAEFVGRWFSQAGVASTVLALFGVRP